MSSFQTHCQESIRIFGKPYEGVHRWLDEFMGTEGYGMRHRKLRHHLEGIKQVRELFGGEAGEVARRHIISDLKEEGWTEDDHFPENQKDYVVMGLFCWRHKEK
ncbi:MAG: hypothetical protein HN416_13885 [Nitrospina sp.]|jgi:hypothetical protein|nr:hypothetical protein [Nitrospina sp.]